MQSQYNLLYREEERDVIPSCVDQGIGFLPWSPLARGLLAGNRTSAGERLTTRAKTDVLYRPELDAAVFDRVKEVAEGRGVPAAQVALAWLLHKPGVTAPILGATRASHVDDMLSAVELQLSDDELRGLEACYTPYEAEGPHP